MRRLTFFVLFSIGILVLDFVVSDASAVGLGFYGAFGSGNAEWKSDYSDSFGSTADKDTRYKDFGLLLDTADTRDTVFSYRLNVGYETLNAVPGEGSHSYDLHGIVIDNLDTVPLLGVAFGICRQVSVQVPFSGGGIEIGAIMEFNTFS